MSRPASVAGRGSGCDTGRADGPAAPPISVHSAFLDGRKPEAAWIWDDAKAGGRNHHVLVRRTFELKGVPAAAVAYVSASSFADVYINGRLLDRCPMNCDPEYQVYERYDIRDHLRPGLNTIAALVYDFGLGMHHRLAARGGFFFQAEVRPETGGVVAVRSDGAWRVRGAGAWDEASELRTGSAEGAPNLIGFVERFDARLMPDGWMGSGFDDSAWRPAAVLGVPPVEPWNSIVVVRRPPLARENVRPVASWTAGGMTVYDFGQEIAGTPAVELESAGGGEALELGTGERILADRTVLCRARVDYTDFYVTRKGRQTWSPLTWRGFRYLQVSAGSGAAVLGVAAVERHYDLRREGSFECSDALLNRIWETGARTLLLCAQDTYMDTPWREQTQYIAGDSRYLQKYAFYSFGLSSELLTGYNILSGAWSQRWRADGAIRSRYPTGWLLGPNTSACLADYELEWVIMLGEYHRFFGDAEIVRRVYPNLRKLLGLFDGYVGKEHGLLADVPGWIVLDHPDTYPLDQRSEITGLNCLYHGALKQAAFLARTVAGDPAQAAAWEAAAGRIRTAVRRWLRPASGSALFADSFGSPKCSQQTQVYALMYGLVDEAERDSVVEAVAAAGRMSEEAFAYYVLYSVFDDRPQWALDYIRRYWGEQMRSPLFNGAWFEAWNIADWKTDLGSTSHAWCSGPTALLPQKVLGVEPLEPGWRAFSVRPEPGDLEWAKGTVPSPYGAIRVEWKRLKGGAFQLDLNVPRGTSAEIALPSAGGDGRHGEWSSGRGMSGDHARNGGPGRREKRKAGRREGEVHPAGRSRGIPDKALTSASFRPLRGRLYAQPT